MDAVCVDTEIEVIENALDDFAKGQRHDSQIVAVEAQDRDANEEAHDGSKDRADNERNGEAQRGGGNGILQGNGCGSAHEGADAHEARVAQGQLTEDTHGEVQGHRHDHVGADGHQHALERGAQMSALGDDLHDDESRDDHAVG